MTIRDSVNLLLSTAPSSATARIGERIGKADEEAMGGATPEAAAIALVAIARQNPRSGELLRMIQTAGMDQHIDEATYLLGQRLRTDAALGIISGTTKKEGNPFERLEEGLLETLTLNTDNPVPLAGLAETAAYAAGYNADNTLFSPVIQHLYRADTGLVVRAIHGARDISDEAAERLLEQFAVRLDDAAEAILRRIPPFPRHGDGEITAIRMALSEDNYDGYPLELATLGDLRGALPSLAQLHSVAWTAIRKIRETSLDLSMPTIVGARYTKFMDLVHGNEGWKDEQRIRRKGNSYDLLKDANRLLTDALDEANEDKASLQAEIDRLRAPRKPLPTRKPSKPQRILSKPQGAPGRMRKKAHNTGDSKGTSHGEPQQTSRGPRSFRR